MLVLNQARSSGLDPTDKAALPAWFKIGLLAFLKDPGHTVLLENKPGKTVFSDDSRPDGLAGNKTGKTDLSEGSRPGGLACFTRQDRPL